MPIELDEIQASREHDYEQRRREARKARYRQLREERGNDKKSMARELGVSRNTWARWENEGDLPSTSILRALHDLTGYDHLWLRGD